MSIGFVFIAVLLVIILILEDQSYLNERIIYILKLLKVISLILALGFFGSKLLNYY